MIDDPTDNEEGEFPPPLDSTDSAPTEPVDTGVTTAPIAVVPTPPKRTGPFRIYSPHDPDLTDEMRHEIEMRMTAGFWLHKALQDEDRVEMPDEFRERKVIWRLVLQEALVVLSTLLVSWLLIVTGLGGWMNTITLGVLLVGLIVGLYVYKLWSITFVVSTATKTGISRERVRWMFINEIKPELATKDIIVSKPYRNSIFSTFDINWWRVNLDTAAQDESAAVQVIRFMRDGDRFVDTLEQFKLALR